jgi:hypothetical protein
MSDAGGAERAPTKADHRAMIRAMTKLQWVYVIVGLVIVLSMVLAYFPVGR